MKTIVLLTAILLCAAAAQADKPTDPGSQGQGNGNSAGGNGNGAGGNGNPHSNPSTDPNAGSGASNGNGDADDQPAAGQPSGASDASSQGNGNAPGGPPSSAGQPGQERSTAAGSSNPDSADAVAGQGPGQSGQSHGNAARPPGHVAEVGGGDQASLDTDASAEGDGSTRADRVDTVVGPAVTEASEALQVERRASGNRLAWGLPTAAAAQVQVWRLDPEGWVPIAVTSSNGQVFDSAGFAHSEYRLTWSEQPLGGPGLAAVATTFSFAPAAGSGSNLGAWLLALLWSGAAAFATVRTAPAPRRVFEARVGDDHQLMPILAGLPGIDVAALDRVVNLGLRTVGQLRRLDADALAFWTGLPAATVRGWQEAVDLLQWAALPPGAAQRLVLAGHASLAQVAAARPADLMATLHSATPDVQGPGLPADEQEVTNWVVEARQALGLANLERASTPASSALPTATA